MKKKISYALTLMLSAVMIMSSCSNETDFYDPTAIDQVQHDKFSEAFEKAFGKVASNVNWGFDGNEAVEEVEEARLTRASVENLTNEQICALTTSEIEAMTEHEKRECLRQLVNTDVNIGNALTIRQLHAFGFKRIICEDLAVSDNCDFDYNDAVFDAKRMEEGTRGGYATFYTILRAEGAHKTIYVGDYTDNATDAYEVHGAFGVTKQEFVNTVGKPRPTDTGAYWKRDHDPVVKIIKVKFNTQTPARLIDIPVYAEGNKLPLTATQGQPAEKICVDLDYSWVRERDHMGSEEWYPSFEHYVLKGVYYDAYEIQHGTGWWRPEGTSWNGTVDVIINDPTEVIPTPNNNEEEEEENNTPTSPTVNTYPKVTYVAYAPVTFTDESFGAEIDENKNQRSYSYVITFKSAPTAVKANAFNDADALGEMTIPGISIGERAFYDCDQLSVFSMSGNGAPASASIGNEAFKGCEKLESFTPSTNLTTIGASAFENCVKLNIDYDFSTCNNLTTIGDNAFAGCSSLTRMRIGSGVTYIGWSAFKNCTNLSEIVILATEPPFKSSAERPPFEGCTNLKKIYVPNDALQRYKDTYRNYENLFVGI